MRRLDELCNSEVQIDVHEFIRRLELQTGQEEVVSLERGVIESLLAELSAVAELIRQCEEEGKSVEGRENIEAALTYLSGGRYFSPEDLNISFESLPGVNLRIPKNEMNRLTKVFPEVLTAEMIRKIKALTQATEGHQKPIICQLPSILLCNGEEIPFNNISAMSRILREIPYKLAEARLPKLDAHSDNELPFSNNGSLTAWTADVIRGSVDKESLEEQIQVQTELLGGEAEVDADLFLAHNLYYLFSKNATLPKEGQMTVNRKINKTTSCSTNETLGVIFLEFRGGRLSLSIGHGQWNSGPSWRISGIGAAYKLS